MNERMQQQQQSHQTALMMAVGQPNIKSYASPSITPSHNYRVQHQQVQIKDPPTSHMNNNSLHASLIASTSQGVGGAGNVNSSIEIGSAASMRGGYNVATSSGSNNIHGRRIDSPDLKVAVNREVDQHQQHLIPGGNNKGRPNTAGHPFLQQFIAGGTGKGMKCRKDEDYMMTIFNQNRMGSAGGPENNNTLTLSHKGHYQANGPKNQRQIGTATIQYYESNNEGVGRVGRAGPKKQNQTSKSINPLANCQKRKKQQSRSAPKYGASTGNYNHGSAGSHGVAPQLINIQIQNAKLSKHTQQPSSQQNLQNSNAISQQIPLRKRPDPTKFFSQGGNSSGGQPSGQMSAPVKSKSRSRSQKRKDKGPKGVAPTHPPKTANQSMSQPKGHFNLKPPKQPQTNQLNKSSAQMYRNNAPIGGQVPPFEMPFAFENKENNSINYDEFSPSRIVNVTNNDVGKDRKQKCGVSNFLDSDSSLGSPQNNTQSHPHAFHQDAVAHSGPQTGKSYYMDKSSFLKNFSPERSSLVDQTLITNKQKSKQHLHDSNLSGGAGHGHNALSSSEREKESLKNNKASLRINDVTNVDSSTILVNNSAKAASASIGTTVISGNHRIHLKVVDKMMKEKLKMMKAKDEQDELSRRKFFEDQFVKQQLQKKAEQQMSNRALDKKKMVGQKAKPAQVGMINVTKANYKKQRSKSCMNKTDNIFCGLPRSKERQQIIQNLQNQQAAQRAEKVPEVVSSPPPQQKPVKKREKSSVLELKELKRLCLEELKRDLMAGKIDVLPTTTSAAFASNKRQSNMVTIAHKKDTKQNQSQTTNQNQGSKGDLNVTGIQGVHQRRNNSKGKETGINPTPQQSLLNPALTSKIKKFIEKKKKMGGFLPKSLEQTILNEKKIKIQENLDNLFKSIKHKQAQHLRQHSYNFLLKKQQVIQQQQCANHSMQVDVKAVPSKKLIPQFFDKKNRKIADNIDVTTLFEHENSEGRGAGDSNSLTPVRASRKSNPRDNDISMDCQEDYQKLLNSIHNRHQQQHHTSKGHHHQHNNSNPPIQNRRRIENQAAQNDSLSIEASKAQKRDTSLKNERRRDHQSKTQAQGGRKVYQDKKLIDELEDRHKQKKEILQRTLVHESNSQSDQNISSKDHKHRSTSSPNTIPAAHNLNDHSTLPPHSDITTLVNDHKHYKFGSTDKRTVGRSDEGSNSNNLSACNYEYREKVQKLLIRDYGSHIQSLKSLQTGKSVKVSKTQVLVTLHSAAIVIQTNVKKFLAKRGFYQDNQYINSEEEEETKTIPAQNLIGKMSPLRVKPKVEVSGERKIGVNNTQFYGANINNEEKVVVCSVITSARPTGEVTSGAGQVSSQAEESQLNSLKTTQNYIPLRYKPQNAQTVINSANLNTSAPNTAVKMPEKQMEDLPIQTINVKETKLSNSEDKTEQKHQKSPVASSIVQEQHQQSANQDSNSRRNIVPSLNLSNLMGLNKNIIEQSQVQLIDNKERKLSEEQRQKGEAQNSTKKTTLFERHSFQDFQEQHSMLAFNPQNYPEMLKIREDAIQLKEKTEKKLLKQMHKSNQLSPRTYEKKRRDLEIWVTKEKEEVKKTKKVFEEEWHKTQNIIKLTQQDQENMKKLLNEAPLSSTHRSKYLEPLNHGEESQPSQRVRPGDTQRAHSSRPEHKSFLDSLQKAEEQISVPQAAQPPSFIEPPVIPAKSSSESIDTPPKESSTQALGPAQMPITESPESDDVIEPPIIEEIHKQDSTEERKLNQEEVQLLNDQLRNEDIDLDSHRILIGIHGKHMHDNYGGGSKIKEVDQLSDEYYDSGIGQSGFNNQNNDSGMHKGLSRTKNSLQLHTLNKNEDDDDEDYEGDQHKFEEHEDEDDGFSGAHNEGIPDKLLPEDEPINSDFRRNILEKSIDGDNSALPAEPPAASQSPNLKEHLHRDNFFIENFDLATPQQIIDQIKQPINRQSPTNEFVAIGPEPKDLERSNKYRLPNDDEAKISSKSSSPDHIIPNQPPKLQAIKTDPMQLNEIDIKFAAISPSEQSLAPVSPNSDTLGSGGNNLGGNLDTKILTGGGSLNSTLSAGEASKQELIGVFKESIKEISAEENKTHEVAFMPAEQQKPGERVIESITEEIYDKLMEELKIEMDLLLLNDPRLTGLIRPGSNDSTQQNQNRLSESGRFPIFDRRGIQTDLFAIERYVEEIYQEVLNDREKFLHNIMEPISRNPSEVLNQLQNSEIGSYEHFEQHFPQVLPLETYLRLERRRKDGRNQQSEDQSSPSQQVLESRNFLAECEHIHNKVLFDCINDSLLQFKPYGKDGSPLPWSRQNRRLKPIEDFTIEEMFEIVKHDLFRWAIMQAGTLPRREFVFGGLFDEELFAEIREKKLATLLAREMIENEPRWLNYEFEEAQVKIDIGDMILEQLVTETITILNERMSGGGAGTAAAAEQLSQSSSLFENFSREFV